MPYSELHRMAKGKLDSSQTKMINTPVDPTSAPDNEFVELVWENGQIMMQGQASRTRKSASGAGFSSLTSKTQERDREDAGNSKSGRFEPIDSVFNDFSSAGPSGQIGLGQDDEMVPWLNYSFDDSHDYCSEFMSELTGANMNTITGHNNAVGKDANYGHIGRDSHMGSLQGGAKAEQRNVAKFGGGSPGGWLCSSSTVHQNQSSVSSLRSSVSGSGRFNTAQGDNSNMAPASNGGQPNIVAPKQDPGPRKTTGQLNNNAGVMNFSHFSRPGGHSRPNIPVDQDKLRRSEKNSLVVSSNPLESMVIDSTSGAASVMGFKTQTVGLPGKMELRPYAGKPPKEPVSTEHSEATCGENVFRSTRDQALGQTSSFATSGAAGRPESEKDMEPVVGSSSMCSGSSAGGTSNEPKDMLKRKSRDPDESEYQSEDAEEESVGVRKPITTRGGSGAKRSRAAEVHNLSERRRRDRINEKMRALQELIPNCNKVDKASMLDEAIEYLKTLQLQVQIMSMGAGMYMPPMMLPPGMHAPHFSPMGMGMGMGMGFGMGMLDMSGGRPLMMPPHMHGMQFSRSPMPGSTNLPMMAGSGLQMMGIPGQGVPMSMQRPPLVPLSEGLSSRSVPVPDISATANLLEGPNPVMPSTSEGIVQSTNLQMMTKTGGECSQNPTLTQSQATKEGFQQSPIVQRNDEASNVRSNADIHVANGNGAFN